MIHVQITFKKGCIHSVQLSLSSTFSWSFSGAGEQKDLIQWLEEYAAGCSKIYPLPLKKLTVFQQKVLQELQKIPFGKTVSYGGLAHAVGQPNAARAVGGACHHNPFPLLIPCHRVINANGDLGGFALGLGIKRRLLEYENSLKP